MRKFFICTMLLLVTASSFCQQTDSNQSLTQKSYLQKSKSQKTAAWVLLGGGCAVAVGAVILDVSSDWSKSETPYLVALFTGCASMVGSIPLFIASARNKRKAKALSTFFNMEKMFLPEKSMVMYYPSVVLRLNF